MLRRFVRMLLLTTLAYPLAGQNLPEFQQFLPGENGLVGDYYFSMVEDSVGFIWACGRTGVFRFDGETFVNYTSTVDHPYTRSLFVDSEGTLWVSTSGGLIRMDVGAVEVTKYAHDPDDPNTISDDRPEPIIEDHDGSLWIGTYDGLNRLDRHTERFDRFYFDRDNGALFENRYYGLVQDRFDPHVLWLASAAGLQQFDTQERLFSVVRLPEQLLKRTGLSQRSSFFGIYQDTDGELWLCPESTNHVIRWHPKMNAWSVYPTPARPSLSPNRSTAVYDVVQQSRHALWVSTVTGIGRFDKSANRFDWLDLDPDRPSAALASAARHLLIDSRGYLWIPSLEGISRSSTPIRPAKREARSVAITGIWSNGVDLLDAPSPVPSRLSLPFNQNSLAFKFNLINPRQPEAVEYGYRLLGFENDINFTVAGSAEYRNLKGGDYILEVISRDGESDWSNIRALQVTIDTVWWQTSWFKLSITLLVLALLLGYLTLRRRQKQREQLLRSEHEKQLAQVQMEALRAQMNPHFLFNTMNSINHFILKNERRAASGYLTKFSRLIRIVLNNSKTEYVKLSDELEALRLYIELEQLRFEDGFDYDVSIEPEVDPDLIFIPPLIIQPYVENSIWHGLMHRSARGRLSLYISRDGQQLVISVRDNGIGREAASLHAPVPGKKRSLGTAITQDRIKLTSTLNPTGTRVETLDLKDEHGAALGTEVIITMAIQTAPGS